MTRPRLAHCLPALAVAAGLGGCSKIVYLEDHPVTGWSPTVVLLHRGGGVDCGPGLPCWPNTLPAVLHGYATLDGAEVDIQLSADGTVWLGHDNEVLDCAGVQQGCFQGLSDAAVDAVAYCDGAAPCTPGSTATCLQHYVRLEEVFGAVTGLDPAKLISLDVKGQYCGAFGVDQARATAEEVDRLVRAYGMAWRVITESSQLAFLGPIAERQTPVHSFVVSLGDIEPALAPVHEYGATGISFKVAPGSQRVDAAVVAGLHRKGVRLILWTIDDPVGIAEAWSAAPDVIETDLADFFRYVP